MRLRFLVPVLGLSSIFAVACSDDDGIDIGGEGGAGGEASAPVGGDGTGGDAVGVGGEGGGACIEGGTGKLVVEVSGLPADVAPDLLVDGPESLGVDEAEVEFEDVASGDYAVTAARVFDADPIVRTVYDATVTAPSFCLASGGEHVVKVAYTAIPSSNKLWMPTARDKEGAAFSSSALAESGLTDASVSIDGGIGKAIAFDRDGNLWTLGPTLDFPHVLRFPAASLGESGTPEPDVSFNLPEVECSPALRSLAIDSAGNLWLSACGDQVLRVPLTELGGVAGDKEADVLIAGIEDNQGLAFDAAGNLWLATAAGIARYDVSRLAESTGDAPDLLLSVADAISPLGASFLAFDKPGNLWATDAIGNVVFKVNAADLDGAGEVDVVAGVSITLDVLALVDQAAFDEAGGLWVGLAFDSELEAGGIGRLSPAQLTTSTPNGESRTPSIVVNSGSIGSGLPVAFFPAPAGLPLYHSIPVE